MALTGGQFIFKTSEGTTPNSLRYPVDATNTPAEGDLCQIVSAEMEYIPSTTTQLTLAAFCVGGINEDSVIFVPGFTAGTTTRRSTYLVGGRSSRFAASTAPMNVFVPITSALQWVMSRKTNAAVTINELYGVDRNTGGGHILDNTDTTSDVVQLLSYYQPDIDAGMALSGGTLFPRVWVKAVLPGGQI